MKLTSKTINYTVDTIEQLLLTTGTENDTIIVTDDNRGGVFVYRADNSSINNGGTIFDGWTRQYDGAINVKWFGAVGDGITADTVAIQNAINFAKTALTTGGTYTNTTSTVYIPSGIYVVDILTLTDGVHVEGEGNSTVLKQLSTNDVFRAMSDTASSEYYYNISVKNLYILGDAGTKSGYAFRGKGLIRSCTIENVSTENFSNGLFLEQCWTFVIEKCQFMFAGNEGIYWDGATAGSIRDCRIDASGTHGIYLRNNLITTETISIENVKAQFSQLSGIRAEGLVSGRIENCFIEGNCQDAVDGVDWGHIHIVGNNTDYLINVSNTFINKGSNGGVGRCGVYVDKIKTASINNVIVQGGIEYGVELTSTVYSASLNECILAVPTAANAIVNNMTNGGFLEVTEANRPKKLFGLDLDPSTPLEDSSLVAGKWNSGNPQYVALGVDAGKPSIQGGGSGTSSHLFLNPLDGVVKINALATLLTSTSSNYNITGQQSTVLINCSGGARTVQLPDEATSLGGFAGRRIVVKKSSNDTNNLTIATLGAALIDGAASIVLNTAYAYAEFQTDGTNWHIIGKG